MTRVLVGRTPDLADGERRVIKVGDAEVVVFMHADRVYAVENRCLHQGGPVGEGMLIGKVTADVDAAGQLLGESFSETETHLVCPWHGWEYGIETGRHAGDSRLRLRTFTTEEVGDEIYVIG